MFASGTMMNTWYRLILKQISNSGTFIITIRSWIADDIDFFYESAPNLRSVKTEDWTKKKETDIISSEEIDFSTLPIVDQMV